MRVCLVIPAAGQQAHAVIRAIQDHHPDVELDAVWAGDPQLRPVPPIGARWIDCGLDEPSGAGWNRLLLSLDAPSFELAKGARAVARQLGLGSGPCVLLRVGSAVVVGSLDGFAPSSGIAVIGRAAQALPVDGLAPSPDDLARYGRYGTAIVGFAADAGSAASAIADAVLGSRRETPPGGAVEAAIDSWGGSVQTVQAAGVAGWSDLSDEVAVVDVTQLDPDEPWRVRFENLTPRHRLSDGPSTADLLEHAGGQWRGVDRGLSLPGGLVVDDPVRQAVSDAINSWRAGAAELPPEPWSNSTSEFLIWLETPSPAWGPDVGRYWTELHRTRSDLGTVFPHPEGGDRTAYADWAQQRWAYEHWSPLLRPAATSMRPPWHDRSRRAGGINLVGYLGFDSSLGDVARRIDTCLGAAGVPRAALHYHRSGSPPSADAPPLTDEIDFATNLLVVNADQMPLLDADYGAALFPGRRTIGYWFWDVEHVPESVICAMRFVDEVWVASEFTAKALEAVSDTPVRVVQIPVPAPEPSPLGRAELGLPEDRFMFLVTFDHLSVTERKNPIGAIEAFRRAFPDPTPETPVLVVKSINASHRWAEDERVRLAAGGRSDIVLIDRHLSRPDQLALIAASNCLVSLHRSEGLGLHLLEAMWLGVPVIATRYSGNLDYMDDNCAALIDATLIPVERGEGYFPGEAVWADPDLDDAAGWMRRLVDDPALAARLAASGRARMQRQPSPADTGARIMQLAGSNRGGR